MSPLQNTSRSQLIRQVKSLQKQVKELKRLNGKDFHPALDHRLEKDNFKSIVANAGDGIMVSNIKSRKIIYVNKKFRSLTGYRQDELMKTNLMRLVVNQEKEIIENILKEIARGEKKSSNYETFLKRKDRKNICVEATITKIMWQNEPALVAMVRDIKERKRAEKNIKEQAKLLDLIFKHSLDSIVLLDKDYNFIRVSESYAKSCQRDSSEFVGRNHFELYPSDFKEEADDVKKGKYNYSKSARPFVFPDHPDLGTTYWDLGLVPILDDEKEIELFLFTLKDVTERKRAEEALKTSEKKYRSLFEQSPVSLWEEDYSGVKFFIDELKKTGIVEFRKFFETHREVVARCAEMVKIISLNKASENLFAISSPDQLSNGLTGFFIEESYPVFIDQLVAVAEGKTHFETEKVLQTMIGERKHINLSWNVPPESENTLSRVIISLIDITERKKAEIELRESELKFRNLADNSPNMIFINQEGRIVYVNKVCELTMGYTTEEFYLPDFDFRNLIDPEFLEQIMYNFKLHLDGKNVAPMEYAIRTKSNQRINAIINTKLIAYGGKKAILGIITDISERKQTEVALKASEQRLSSFLESATDGFILFDSELTHILVNDAVLIMAGLERSEMLGKNIIETVPDIKESGRYDVYMEVIKTGNPVFLRDIITHKKYGRKHVEIKAFKVGNGLGVIFTDITERIRVEEALSESENRYRQLVELSPDAIMVHQDGKFVFANEAAVNIFNAKSKDDFIGSPIIDRVHPDYREIVKSRVGNLDGHRLNHVPMIEEKFIKFDGTVFDVEVTANQFLYKGKGAVQVIARDISDRKKAEIALKESEYLLKQSQKVSGLGSYVLDIKTGVWTSSDILDEIFGIDENYMKDVNGWSGLIHPEERKKMVDYLSKDILSNHESFNREYRIINLRSKEERWVHGLGELEFDKNGKALKMIGTIQDITKRKEFERTLGESRSQLRNLAQRIEKIREKERAQIAREIHDDLGQSLTALKMDIMWMKKNSNLHDEKITAKFDTMVSLIDLTIKTVKQITSELRPGILDDLGLVSAIEWQKDEFQSRFNIKCNLSVSKKNIAPDNEVSVAVFRIFQETLTNIARHSGASKVDIVIDLKEDEILVMEISDNGTGINKEQINSSKSLGLFGMRERIGLLNGQMEISGVPGKGTKVKISIPV